MIRGLWTALRPSQWTKNAVVLAALVFAFGARETVAVDLPMNIFRAVCAALLFCATSSAVYLLNDIRDAEADRRHPFKRQRPIAAGLLPVRTAGLTAAGLLAAALAAAAALSPPFAGVLLLYLLLQAVYTLWLKQVALVDIFIIATGFVLRAVAGAVVLNVRISPWLLLCTFLLALFLALCKRRQEKAGLQGPANGQRAALDRYDLGLLDQLIAIAAASTIVTYAIYTLWPQTVEKFGTAALGFTVPFVVFGIFRYLDLVYRHAQGERPEHVLMKDAPMIMTLLLYGLTLLAVFFLR